mgnify:CR=1 FL=1
MNRKPSGRQYINYAFYKLSSNWYELSKNKKNYSFITEETGTIKNANEEFFWVIDPIDGTNNFLHGIPHFAISIALKIDNQIILSLIHI